MLNLIFDLDGTLIDSARDLHAVAGKLLQEEGHPPLDLPTVKSFIGNGVPKLVERIMEHCFGHVDPQRHQQLVVRFMQHYNAAPTALTRLYPHVAECLQELELEGHCLGLCTNKPSAISYRILRELDIAQHFSAIFGGDTLPVKKPDPAPLLAVIKALGRRPSLYIGDSEIDAQTANAAGYPFLLFTEGYRKKPIEDIPHKARFNDFQYLPETVTRLAEQLSSASTRG